MSQKILRWIILSTRQVTVVFQSGHPRNGAGPKNTFLTVEKFESDGGNWKQILADDDWSTKFEWNRRGISESTASVYWKISAEQEQGIYRVCHYGVHKLFQKTSYSGCSDYFQVEAKRPQVGLNEE